MEKGAVVYLRKSKKSDARSVSLQEQERSVRSYACLQHFTVCSVLSHDGVSGGDRERYARIFRELHDTGAKVLPTYHIDRFARDLAALLNNLEEFKKQGIELWVVGKGKVETARSDQFLLTGVEGVVAQYVRMVGGEKTKAALKMLKDSDRRYSGKPPWGSRFEHGKVVEVADQQEVLLLIRDRRDWPVRSLKRWLAARGGPVPSQGMIWSLQRRDDEYNREEDIVG